MAKCQLSKYMILYISAQMSLPRVFNLSFRAIGSPVTCVCLDQEAFAFYSYSCIEVHIPDRFLALYKYKYNDCTKCSHSIKNQMRCIVQTYTSSTIVTSEPKEGYILR